jgi:hypothetical protein
VEAAVTAVLPEWLTDVVTTEPADGTPLSGSEGAVTFLGGATPHTAGSQELLYLHFLQFFFFREGVVCIFARQALIKPYLRRGLAL